MLLVFELLREMLHLSPSKWNYAADTPLESGVRSNILENAQLLLRRRWMMRKLTFGQTMQHGIAPRFPMNEPSPLIMDPYQPCCDASSVSGLMICA